MRVQRVLMLEWEEESWTLLGDDQVPIEPVEQFLAFLTSIEKSPNTVKAYAHNLKDWFTYLDGRRLDWRAADLEDVAGFVAWLRLPPEARTGNVAVLPTVAHHCSAASVNRKLATLTSFCEFHARHGDVELARLLITMQPAGRRGAATSFKPFLHHITMGEPERRRAIKLKSSPPRPKVLTASQAQAVLDACEHLRDRLLFAVLLDCGLRIGEALGLRHEDMGIAEQSVTITPRSNANRARAKAGISRTIPASAELMRLYADYLTREYGALDSDNVFVNLFAEPHGQGFVQGLALGDGYRRSSAAPVTVELVARVRMMTGPRPRRRWFAFGFHPQLAQHAAGIKRLRVLSNGRGSEPCRRSRDSSACCSPSPTSHIGPVARLIVINLVSRTTSRVMHVRDKLGSAFLYRSPPARLTSPSRVIATAVHDERSVGNCMSVHNRRVARMASADHGNDRVPGRSTARLCKTASLPV